MKFVVYKKHEAVVALYKCGVIVKMICQMLKPLSINKRIVSQTLAQYRETDDIVDWVTEGHTGQTIHAIHEWVRWNHVRKQKHLTVEMNVSNHSLSRILQEDLPLNAYRPYASHLLDAQFKEMYYETCKTLIKRSPKNTNRHILFTDEKIFNIEEGFNRQNDHKNAKSC